ncbi:hypothetical protein [uncultured Clostridium sp.]|uniref:hypothetical protein n=1 Tax=uncultured Clostridium sp. TaxID=59620 RepID=UPI0025FF2D7F|nr:hypothetical protein [uncultured Clostridium sp.]
MNREEFNQLDIKGQVDYFNEELKQENNNFNAICKSLGISKNTILNRFKVNGFEPLRAGQRIIGFSHHVGKEENKKTLESDNMTLTAQNCSVEIKNLTAENSAVKNPILDSEKLMVKNKSKASDPKDINLILKRIELLEKKVEEYNTKLCCTKEYLNGDLRSDKNFINSYENTTTKTFKIDVEVYQELENLFDKYKMYKRQDIVSSLLKYALDNIE